MTGNLEKWRKGSDVPHYCCKKKKKKKLDVSMCMEYKALENDVMPVNMYSPLLCFVPGDRV